MAGATQGAGALRRDSGDWNRRAGESVPGEGQGSPGRASGTHLRSQGDRSEELEGLKAAAAARVCPEKASAAARAKLALLGVVTLLGACTSQQRAETAHAAEVFSCEVRELAPYVPDALSAEQLVQDVVMGRANLAVALARLGTAPAKVDEVVDAFNACFAGHGELQPTPAELAPKEPTTALRAPPPAYGNKIL